jgi:hypothetical protein
MPGPLKKSRPFRGKRGPLPGQSSDVDLGLDLRVRTADRPSTTIINKEFVQVGNVGRGDYVEIDHDSLSLFGDGKLCIELETDGDVFIGSDISAPGTTYFSIFANNQTYNTESVKAGDMLIGDNSASKANIYWDESEGQLKFRGGKTTELYIDTDGTLVAGDGDVELDSDGITLYPGTDSSKKLKVDDGGTLIVEIYGTTDPGASSQLSLVGRGRGGSGPVTHEGLVEIIAITDDGAAHDGAASTTITMSTSRDSITVVAGTFTCSKAAVFNEAGDADSDFRIEGYGQANAFFVDGGNGSIGIRTNSPNSDSCIDMGSAGAPIILPIMTGEQIATLSAAEGMLAYNSTDGTLDYYDGSSWLQLTGI